MKILVTGATGYLGTRFVNFGVNRGHIIVAASRRRPFKQNVSWIPFDISSSNFIKLPSETFAIMHLAFNSHSSNTSKETCEVNAAINLINLAKEAGAKFIFVSSQTARFDAPTAYGRNKWRIEQLVLSSGGWVVRPGQVYGGQLQGLFGVLVDLIRKLRILPAFSPAPMVQPIHVDDLVDGLLRIAERTDLPSGVYCLASPEAISFSSFLGEIAESRLRCRRWFFPAPIVVINALVFAFGKSMRTWLGLERLQSLFDMPAMDTSSDLKNLGLTLRPLKSGMHSSGSNRRRYLLLEGRALLALISKKPSGIGLLRCYVRAIESMQGGRVLGLPKVFLRHPILLTLIEKTMWTNESSWKDYIWRMDAATRLVESTPLGFVRKHGLLNSLQLIAKALACDLLRRATGVLLSKLIFFAMHRKRNSL